jgi:hypothetical protein
MIPNGGDICPISAQVVVSLCRRELDIVPDVVGCLPMRVKENQLITRIITPSIIARS